MAAADLFDYADLAAWLQEPAPGVDDSTVDRVRRWAYGWLLSATGLAALPVPTPDDLWAWGVELAGIAYRNSAGTTSEQVDDYSVTYDRARKAEILTAAARVYGGSSTPQYSFPDPDWHWTVTPDQVFRVS